jgi:hypothetical protein
MVYVAVDIGKRRCVTCVMDEDGSILDTGSMLQITRCRWSRSMGNARLWLSGRVACG